MSEPNAAAGELKRVVGFWGAVLLGLGSIVGTGVFVSLAIAAGIVGEGVLIAVVLAGLVAMANGISSAQLAAAHPVSGGTYEYGYRFVGEHAGFVAGFMYLTAKSASAATAALGFAGYLLSAFGASDVLARIAIALALIVVLTALAAGGLRRSNLVNALIVSLTLTVLGLFVFFGFTSEGVLLRALSLEEVTSTFNRPKALLHGTALLFVAYTGYGRVATLGEEVDSPRRVIPKAILTTLLVTVLLYVSVAAAAIATMGARGFAATLRKDIAPLELVARRFDADWVAMLVAGAALIAMAGVLLNLLLGLSRVLLAMARRRDMPSALSVVNDTGSPKRAVIAIGVFVALIALAGDLRLTWSFSAFTVLVYYGITNLAALRMPEEHRRFPRVISLAGFLSCFGLAFFVEWRVWALGLSLLALALGVRALLRHWRRP